MPRWLLDEHISPHVAEAAERQGLTISSVAATALAGSDDLTILRHAIADDRIVVTYDMADYSVLLGVLAREGSDAPGVVFIDRRTIPASDIGGLATALVRLDARLRDGPLTAASGLFLRRA